MPRKSRTKYSRKRYSKNRISRNRISRKSKIRKKNKKSKKSRKNKILYGGANESALNAAQSITSQTPPPSPGLTRRAPAITSLQYFKNMKEIDQVVLVEQLLPLINDKPGKYSVTFFYRINLPESKGGGRTNLKGGSNRNGFIIPADGGLKMVINEIGQPTGKIIITETNTIQTNSRFKRFKHYLAKRILRYKHSIKFQKGNNHYILPYENTPGDLGLFCKSKNNKIDIMLHSTPVIPPSAAAFANDIKTEQGKATATATAATEINERRENHSRDLSTADTEDAEIIAGFKKVRENGDPFVNISELPRKQTYIDYLKTLMVQPVEGDHDFFENATVEIKPHDYRPQNTEIETVTVEQILGAGEDYHGEVQDYRLEQQDGFGFSNT